MRRIHLFEFHDLAWFPAVFRDALTEWLRVLWERVDAYTAIASVLSEALRESGALRVIDLCSGGSGPLAGVQRKFEAAGQAFRATVTDKFPNYNKMKDLQENSKGLIEAYPAPVDATAVPHDLIGLRTLFNSFHHFRPAEATQILADAYHSRQPIGVFEIPNRTISGVAFSFLATFLGVLLLTPSMRPRRFLWWVFTYLIPVIPLIVAWDGWVSHLRAYTPAELLCMTGDFSESYRWETRTIVLHGGRFTMTCLLGLPLQRAGTHKIETSSRNPPPGAED